MTSRNRELADIMSEAASASSGQVLTTNTNSLYWETAAGGGLFKGENGTTGSSAGDIFRINEQTLNTNVTISNTENARIEAASTPEELKLLTLDTLLA